MTASAFLMILGVAIVVFSAFSLQWINKWRWIILIFSVGFIIGIIGFCFPEDVLLHDIFQDWEIWKWLLRGVFHGICILYTIVGTIIVIAIGGYSSTPRIVYFVSVAILLLLDLYLSYYA